MSTSPYPPLALADGERDRMEFLAHRLVHKALADYDAHHQSGARVDASNWKLVRKCEQLAMYKRIEPSTLYQPTFAPQHAMPIRSRSESASVVDHSTEQGRSRQKMPELLQVGVIRSTLNEVMYGTIAVDRTAMLLKTAYTDDTLLDGETLCQLRGPSAAHPFRFVGVKWAVKSTSHITRAPMVRPRELLYVEATGVLTREGSSQRVGYHLMHSIDVPGYGALDDRKVVRGNMSSCILYTETPDATGAVEVFMKGHFEPSGSISEKVATLSASLGMMSCSKISVCAQSKKLMWLLRSSPESPGHQRPSGFHRHRRCPICSKGFTMFSGTASCELCSTLVCTSCFVKKRLAFAKPGSKRVTVRAVSFCTSCLTHARRLDDFDAARQEVLSAIGVTESGSAGCAAAAAAEPLPGVPNCKRRDLRRPPSVSKTQFSEFLTQVSGAENTPKRVSWEECEAEFRQPKVTSDMEESHEIDKEVLISPDPRVQRSNTYPTPFPAATPRQSSQSELMERIIAMQNAAEDAYRTTRQTHYEMEARNHAVHFSGDRQSLYPAVR